MNAATTAAAVAAPPLLQVSGIEVIYNHVILVLKGVSLQVPQGGIVALLGSNGAGKSTLLRIMAGVDHDFLGEARPLPGTKLGYLPQEQSIFRQLTVWENLQAILETRNLTRKERMQRGEELL